MPSSWTQLGVAQTGRCFELKRWASRDLFVAAADMRGGGTLPLAVSMARAGGAGSLAEREKSTARLTRATRA